MVSGMTRGELRELGNLVIKFEEMELTKYYRELFPKIHISDVRKEELQLLKNSGMLYIEQIIAQSYKGKNR